MTPQQQEGDFLVPYGTCHRMGKKGASLDINNTTTYITMTSNSPKQDEG